MEDYTFLIGFGVLIVAVIVIGNLLRKHNQKEAAERARLNKIAVKRAEAAKTIKKIFWGNQFSVDKGVIDRDHQALFGLINDFNDGIAKYEKPNEMVSILASLTKYTQTHFKREEKLQELSAFPFCDEHKKEHKALIEKFNGLIEKAMRSNEDNITDVAVEIGTFLREWLTGHVFESDLPLKPYVDRMREHAAGMGELAQK